MILLKTVLSAILVFGLTLPAMGCSNDGTTIGTSINPSSSTTTSSPAITAASSTVPSVATTKDINVPFKFGADPTNSGKQGSSLSTALGDMGNGDPLELANDANAAIYSSFARNNHGSIMYPGDFGGAYFADGKLIVCITQEQSRDHYQSLLNASQKSIVIYKAVKHSFNDLMQLAKELATKEDAFITYGVDVMNNRAEVCLPNEAKVKSNNLSNSNSDIPVVYKYMQYLKIDGNFGG